MKKFSDLVRDIREQADLSQEQFAKELDVSAIYISKIETDKKDVSKNFVTRLAGFTGIHPSALAPFMYLNDDIDVSSLSSLEKSLIEIGEKLQSRLVKKRLLQKDET